MTKHLLTALLIAGFSVTAKAEPTVYYCNTTAYAVTQAGDVSNLKSYPFKLFVDLESRKVKVAGDVNFATELTDGKLGARVRKFTLLGLGDDALIPGFSEDAFYAHDIFTHLSFEGGTLQLSDFGADANSKRFVRSIIARCDKF